ncbi:hypothetical protein ACIBCD_15080 [Nocardia brasiliensis]|uniref:hypothetical protein n=1 Tax=Nocardia brasiliensis TaxID=37326 RepID=UPI00056CAB5A|nr:hypothetical protein [Nocardia brasiliensis]
MVLRLLGGPTGNEGSPRLWIDDDRGVYCAQGLKVPGQPDHVEIPHMLLTWLAPDTHLGATLTDTGRGTFTLAGLPVVDDERQAVIQTPDHEICIEIPAAATERRW